MFKSENMAAAARSIFKESLVCYMSKTIRAFEKLANNLLDLRLVIMIVSDTTDNLNADFPTCLTEVYEPPKLKESNGKQIRQRDELRATIYIHPHASRTMAKFAIAHELGHLYLSLCKFAKDKKYAESFGDGNFAMLTDPVEENKCNLFAVALCSYHHNLNLREDTRSKFKLFPQALLDAIEFENIKEGLDNVNELNVDETNSLFTEVPDLPSDFFH